MEELMNVSSIPMIVALVYFAIHLYKIIIKNKTEKFFQIIPVIAGVLGTILGILSFYLAPEIIPVNNLFMAILVGGISGLASTGADQIFRQFKK